MGNFDFAHSPIYCCKIYFFLNLSSMSRNTPYQPLPLRFLHGIIGLLAIAAILTGFVVYNAYDGRYGSIPLPAIPDSQGIHGTFGLTFLLVLPLFALYSFHAGQKRLIPADVLPKLTQQIGKPPWWSTLQRTTNTIMLLAATFSVITGRMMKEAWLPAGQLHHIWYSLHLTGWAILVVCLALLMSARVGGAPLLLSMWSWQRLPDDNPAQWRRQFQSWWQQIRSRN
jgi:hypothetical protein